MFKITKPGEYRTREGKKAVVLVIDENIPGVYPVVGYTEGVDGVDTWATSGTYCLGNKNAVIQDIVAEWSEPVASSALSKFLQYVRELEELKDATEDLVHSIDWDVTSSKNLDIDSIDRIEDVLKRLRDAK
jgi:hypothetical protein